MRNDGTHAGPAKNKRIKADEALESRPSLPEPDVKKIWLRIKWSTVLNIKKPSGHEREHAVFCQKDEIKTNTVN